MIETANAKPTHSEWEAVMKVWKENKNEPHEIKEHGQYYFDHFTEVLPPLHLKVHEFADAAGIKCYVQCSEPYSGEGVSRTFHGVYMKHGKWYGGIFTSHEFLKKVNFYLK